MGGPAQQFMQPSYQGQWYGTPSMGYQPGFQPSPFQGGQYRFHPQDVGASRMQEVQAPRQDIQANPPTFQTSQPKGAAVGGQTSESRLQQPHTDWQSGKPAASQSGSSESNR